MGSRTARALRTATGTATGTSPEAARTSRPVDRAGAILFAAVAAWTLVAWVVAGGNPLPVLFVLAVAGGGVILGRGLGWPRGPLLVVGLAAVLGLFSITTLFSDRAASGPFGYANAKVVFYLVATAGALMLTSARGTLRVLGLAAAAVFALVALRSGFEGAALLVVLLPPLGLVAVGPRTARITVVLCGLLVAGALAGTMYLAAAAPGPTRVPFEDQAAARLGETRLALWGEALDLARARPVTGVGPGRYSVESPLGRSDRDLRWAHHGFLHQAAEGGWVAFGLLVLLFGWGFARLWAAESRNRVLGLGAVALAGLGIGASVDYVLHFPAIPLAAAILVGSAHSGTRDREFRPGPLLRRVAKAGVLPLGVLSPRREGDVIVLLYHRVGAGDREIDLPVELFEAQMAELADHHPVLTLDAALAGDHPEGGVVVTFDDGYEDFHRHVLPVLVRRGLPATLYLATGLVSESGDGGSLTWDHLREAVDTGLVSVGSHTHSHVGLVGVTEEVAEEEMRRSQGLVEDRLGVSCRHFAYPWGVGSSEADRAARRLFDSAALAWETNRAGRIDPYRLGRLPVMRSDGRTFFRAKLRGLLDREAALYRLFGRGPWRWP